MRYLLLTIAIAVAGIPVSAVPPAPRTGHDGPTIIDSVISAYGGIEALQSVTAYRMQGTITSRMSGHGTFTRLVVRPDRLDVMLHYADRVEIRMLNGERGGRSRGGAPVEVTGPLLASMKLQRARSLVPWILDERRQEVQTIAPLERNGRTFAGLELDLEPGLALRIYLDPETHYVVQTQGLLDVGGMQTHFETEYANHEQVDGIVFAMREVNFASGVPTGQTTIETVTINPEIRSDGFSPGP